MSSKVSKILISGAGQLGSRYLQGLIKCPLPLKIFVQDVSEKSLLRAENVWKEIFAPETPHEVSFQTSLISLPSKIDIVIVATTADVRPKVVVDIASGYDVRFWVLEKLLAQSESGLDQIISSIQNNSTAWVNTPRRMISWHKKIKSQLNLDSPLSLKLEGRLLALASNAIHFLDLIEWWTGETLQSVSVKHLDENWYESKRPAFWEVLGNLEAQFSGGSFAVLGAGKSDASCNMEVSDYNHNSWLINEVDGFARRSDGVEILGHMTKQSEMTAHLVESILETGACELPTLNESTELHRILIRSLLQHYKSSGHPEATFIPIT
jgi:hypothetical protein